MGVVSASIRTEEYLNIELNFENSKLFWIIFVKTYLAKLDHLKWYPLYLVYYSSEVIQYK